MIRGHNVDLQGLAAAVREKRKEKGLSQKGLGEMFKVSQTYVGWLELGKAERLDEGKVRDICALLEVDISDFIKGGEPGSLRGPRKAREMIHEQERAPALPEKTEARGEQRERMQFQPIKEYRPGGKERQRFIEWVKEKTRIRIKLTNGEILEGYMKWWDTYTLKLVTAEHELVVSKSAILYFIDAPKKPGAREGFSRPSGGETRE